MDTLLPQKTVYSCADEVFLSRWTGDVVPMQPDAATVIIANTRLAHLLDSGALSPDERARECRFRRESDRRRFRTAHFLKRAACAAATGRRFSCLTFRQDANGKPLLEHPGNTFFFNLSHSGDWSGVAIGGIAPLGFDVQHPVDTARLPPEIFGMGNDIRAPGDPGSRTLRWAMLEAAVKESGIGLSHPLPAIEVEETGDAHMHRAMMSHGRLLIWSGLLRDGSALAVAAANPRALDRVNLYELAGLAW